MSERDKILETEWCPEFIKGMQDRMVTSYYKYGPIAVNYGQGLIDVRKSIDIRLQKFDETGNLEFLMDISNLCQIAFKHPQHPKAHYRPTDSKESPGLHGMSINEIKAFKEENE